MAHVLIMPRQGNSVESCILVTWKVREGDVVTPETPACDVETDKATFEVPAGAAGTVLKCLFPEGEDIPVLQPIAVIGDPGEDWKAAVGGEAPAPVDSPEDSSASGDREGQARAEDAPPRDSPAQAPVPGSPAPAGTLGSSPRARRLATREAVRLETLAGSGPGGRVIERDVKAAVAGRPPLTAAARAALAAGAPVPPAGSGIGGRATLADVPSGTGVPSALPPDEDFPGPVSETVLKGVRKLIAKRMLESLTSTAQFTLNSAADATRLQALRARFKKAPEALGNAPEAMALGGITLNDLLLYLVSRILPQFPDLNAHKVEERLRVFDRVHLGVAVDTPRGLMVPVLRNADRCSLAKIAAETRRLAEACRVGTVTPDELSGSTFTVTNLGVLGVESFTPVLNTPEVAILGIGGLVPRPLLDKDGTATGFAPFLGLSLTINHQVVDGAPAARFLQALRDAIADVDLWLMRP